MKKWFKKTVAVILTSAMVLSAGVPAFALETEKAFEAYTLGETQEMMAEYLLANNNEIEIGTEEYYNFIIEQLLYDTDESLKSHPHYDLLHAYMVEYKIAYEDAVTVSTEENISLVNNLNPEFYENDNFLDKTFGEIKLENQQQDIAETKAQSINNAVTASSYNASAAVAYARLYAYARNAQYPDYTADCTNFVSQCIHAGGIGMNGTTSSAGVNTDTSKWYSVRFESWGANSEEPDYTYGVTSTWIRVNELRNYLIKYEGKSTASAESFATLLSVCKVGDIVQLKNTNTGSIYHTVIASGVTSTDIEYCAHTTDRKDYSLNKLDDSVNSFLLIRM